MARVTLKLWGLTCDKCVQHVTEDLSELEGVDSVEITRGEDKSGTAVVTGAAIPADEVLIETVKGAGDYTVEAIERQ
ncbi:heavy-metal-associated domain-containing protein [Mobiluncus mulieris]|uniref:Heavy metal-associated domain protein n=2 Tax=Mobiluncus mulieris TaxID=2052 RepID=E0QNA2_9ACTO|nr:heavy-metal-associated domain-containing protein [Mobiluncus mulieris]EFM46874.1 heavy metal-associated domain protein [Mobiluncus mulieris ATCC 35239]EFN94084.1 heavy metal-associated domain protein [Mobiluncus mulieris FB024-16]MCU9994666.1 heavy-metal-associated domain-containing protein [Mobiluncus mulieris]MCU9997125.1 heavy-metal-associated domain-containing protein [Mobiluncus mulieris]MCV0014554.1 heavy-metal-associated domain-containing protein [Mobiluncus mulieris]